MSFCVDHAEPAERTHVSGISGSGEGMTKYDSESLPFEPPEQENIRLLAENARLRRLLSVHGIPIPQLAPDNQPPNTTIEPARLVDKEERARKRIALFRSLFSRQRRRGDGRMAMADTDIGRW
jgi:hypothetical protein